MLVSYADKGVRIQALQQGNTLPSLLPGKKARGGLRSGSGFLHFSHSDSHVGHFQRVRREWWEQTRETGHLLDHGGVEKWRLGRRLSCHLQLNYEVCSLDVWDAESELKEGPEMNGLLQAWALRWMECENKIIFMNSGLPKLHEQKTLLVWAKKLVSCPWLLP